MKGVKCWEPSGEDLAQPNPLSWRCEDARESMHIRWREGDSCERQHWVGMRMKSMGRRVEENGQWEIKRFNFQVSDSESDSVACRGAGQIRAKDACRGTIT